MNLDEVIVVANLVMKKVVMALEPKKFTRKKTSKELDKKEEKKEEVFKEELPFEENNKEESKEDNDSVPLFKDEPTEVRIDGILYGVGTAGSKKESEQEIKRQRRK